jgi:hypothetical protein
MPQRNPKITVSSTNIRWLADQFKLNLIQKHPVKPDED